VRSGPEILNRCSTVHLGVAHHSYSSTHNSSSPPIIAEALLITSWEQALGTGSSCILATLGEVGVGY
jgi:hypothetical protein